MAAEFRRKGVNVLLGPVVGPAWRVVRGGRNWEGFSVDPYLSGLLVSESVQGIQAQGVQASVKVGTSRGPTWASLSDCLASTLSPMSKRPIAGPRPRVRMRPYPPTLTTRRCMSCTSGKSPPKCHRRPSPPDTTLPPRPFQDAVRAGAGNIMCSYQRINNSYGCANSKTLNGLLKTELGFQVRPSKQPEGALLVDALTCVAGIRGGRLGRPVRRRCDRSGWAGLGHAQRRQVLGPKPGRGCQEWFRARGSSG